MPQDRVDYSALSGFCQHRNRTFANFDGRLFNKKEERYFLRVHVSSVIFCQLSPRSR
jgi:hypothetical protein